MRKLKLSLWHDPDLESPDKNGDGQWTIYSFGRRHVNYKDPDEFLPPSLGLRRKLKVGTAFLLSYYEHLGCVWSLQGEGTQCEWDTVQCAGILLWEHPVSDMGAKTLEDRRKDAASFLETYTAWCNGECYGWSLDDEEDNHVGSCGGFYGDSVDDMAASVRDELREGDVIVEIDGDVKCLADYHDFGQKKRRRHDQQLQSPSDFA